MQKIEHIVVVGAGTMGAGIGGTFAQAGYDVTLVDIKKEILEKAFEQIRSNLNAIQKIGLINERDVETTLSRIDTTLDLAEATKKADLVEEAALEKLELKQDIFRVLDKTCSPEAILATNTSGLSISKIAAATKSPERVVGIHFLNPPHLVRLVEVIRGDKTRKDVIDASLSLLKNAGKAPVLVADVPGFLHNRLLYALIREALSMVEGGIVSVEDVDTVMKLAFGPRFKEIGLFGLVDIAGLDVYYSVSSYLNRTLNNATEASEWIGEKVRKGELGFKSNKGFYKWTDDEKAKVRDRLSQGLASLLKEK